MKCPYCESTKNRVTDTRKVPRGIRRRRTCKLCGRKWTTHERHTADVSEQETHARVMRIRRLLREIMNTRVQRIHDLLREIDCPAKTENVEAAPCTNP
jgi:transcriptional regulator NrdR family protein